YYVRSKWGHYQSITKKRSPTFLIMIHEIIENWIKKHTNCIKKNRRKLDSENNQVFFCPF
ncbi:hypothetical protein ACOSHH_005344, partial [Klebsiella aerogenes]